MSATVRPSFSGKTRGIRPQKGMPLPEEIISVLDCVPRPQAGIGKALFSSPGGVRNVTRVRPRHGEAQMKLLFRPAGAISSRS